MSNGNLLSEGMYFIGPTIGTENPTVKRLGLSDAVAFHVVDSMDGCGARMDSAGNIPGVVRPLLNWETQFSPHGISVVEGSVIAENNR